MNGFAMLHDESGASTVEYALVLALLAMTCIVAIGGLSTAIQQRLQSLSQTLTNLSSG